MATRRDLETRLLATDQASKVIDKVADELDKLEKKGDTEIDLTVDDKASKDIDSVSRKLAGLSDEDKRVVLTAQARDAQRDIDRIIRSLAQVERMDQEEVDIRVRALGDARTELERIERQVRDLDDERVDIPVDADTTGVRGKLTQFRTDLSNAQGGFGKLRVAGKAAFEAIGPYAAEAGLVAGAAVATFVAKSGTQFSDLALEIGKARDALGLTAEDASRLKEVAEDLGIPFETLQTAIGRMNKTAGTTPDVFENIGASIERSDDGAIEVKDTFLEVVDALKNIPDAAARAAAGQKIFGKGWTQIAELVMQGADGVTEAMAEVGEGKIVTDAQIAEARELRDSVDGLRDRFEEFSNTIGSTVAPVLADLADGLGTVLSVTGDLFTLLQGDFDIPVLSQAVRYLNPVTGGFNILNDSISGAKKEMEDFAGVTHGTVGPMASLNTEMTTMERVALDVAAAEAQAARATKDQYESATEAAPAVAFLKTQQEAAAEAAEAQRQALEDLREEMLAGVDNVFAYEKATHNLADAVAAMDQAAADANATIADSEATDADKVAALQDVREAEIAAAEQVLATAEAYATQTGAAEGSTEHIAAMKEELQRQAEKYPALRDEIQTYIDKLDAIPPEVSTTATAYTDTATGRLNTLHEQITAIDGSTIDIFTTVHGGQLIRQFGGGGTVPSGGTLARVGEYGPELVALPGGAHVYTAGQTRQMAATPAGSAPVNVTIQAAVIGNQFDVDRTVRQALKRSVRINGNRPYR